MLIGLTATPKKDICRNAYSLFGIEGDNPTFAYELNKAVTDGFLVLPIVMGRVLRKAPRQLQDLTVQVLVPGMDKKKPIILTYCLPK